MKTAISEFVAGLNLRGQSKKYANWKRDTFELNRRIPTLNWTDMAFRFSTELFTIAQLHRLRPANVVDLGCGDGLLPYCLHNERATAELLYLGIDARPGSAWKANRVTDYVCADLLTVTMESKSVQCLVMMEVFEHLKESDGWNFLKKASTWLKPGGWFVMTFPIWYEGVDMQDEFKKFGHLHYTTPEIFLERASRVGLKPDVVVGSRFFGNNKVNVKALQKAVPLDLRPLIQRYGSLNVASFLSPLLPLSTCRHLNLVLVKQ